MLNQCEKLTNYTSRIRSFANQEIRTSIFTTTECQRDPVIFDSKTVLKCGSQEVINYRNCTGPYVYNSNNTITTLTKPALNILPIGKDSPSSVLSYYSLSLAFNERSFKEPFWGTASLVSNCTSTTFKSDFETWGLFPQTPPNYYTRSICVEANSFAAAYSKVAPEFHVTIF